jgi:DNA polymerase I-like protein with 3'-5' exonuclease and polymerase domains
MTNKQEKNTVVQEMEYEELKLQVKQLENINKNILSQLVSLEKEIKNRSKNKLNTDSTRNLVLV